MNTIPSETLPESAPTFERAPEYTIYKPNNRNTGAVMRFSFNKAKQSLFVEAAPQAGEKQFDWEKKIIMKWGLADMGTILATLQGRQGQGKLFHQSERANSSFDLTYRDDPERAPYLMSFSRQENADKSVKKIAIPVSHSEAAILEIALHQAIRQLLAW